MLPLGGDSRLVANAPAAKHAKRRMEVMMAWISFFGAVLSGLGGVPHLRLEIVAPSPDLYSPPYT